MNGTIKTGQEAFRTSDVFKTHRAAPTCCITSRAYFLQHLTEMSVFQYHLEMGAPMRTKMTPNYN